MQEGQDWSMDGSVYCCFMAGRGYLSYSHGDKKSHTHTHKQIICMYT